VMLLTLMKPPAAAAIVISAFIALVSCSGCANSTDQADVENPAVAKRIENYLMDFGMPGTETSWYKNIVGIRVRGSTVYVKTNLFSNTGKAGDICAAVSGFVFDKQNSSYGLANVQVLDPGGQILVNRRGVSGRCD